MVSTPFANIFSKYGALVEDTELLSILTDSEYTELLEIFLSKAKSIYFKSCKKDLTAVDDILKEFNQTLSDEEQWIIAESMKLVWVERQLYKEQNLRDRLTTKDYNSFSKSALLGKLSELKNDTLKKLKALVVDYTFNDFGGFK